MAGLRISRYAPEIKIGNRLQSQPVPNEYQAMSKPRHDVLVFGGPLHGERRKVEGNRFSVATWCPNYGLRDASGDRWIPKINDDVFWYEVQPWGHRAGPPFRRRALTIAVLEGYCLSDQEKCAVRELLGLLPWELEPGSILGTPEEFEQWFACQWHKQTGEMYWKDRRVW